MAIAVPDSERRSSYAFHSAVHILNGDIDAFEWTRFRYFAGRVRIITDAGTSNIDAAVFQSLTHFSHGRPLIPSLKEFSGNVLLDYGQPDHYRINDAELVSMMSPSVRRLRIKLRDTTGCVHPPFPTDDVPKCCCISLQILCQGTGPYLPTSRILSVTSMAGLTELSHVDVSRCRSTATFGLLCHLSKLGNLVDLAVEVGAYDDIASHRGFAGLQTLNMRGKLSGIMQLITSIISPRLRTGDVADGIENIWCQTIGTISSRFTRSASDFIDKQEYVLRIIRPLLDLHDLECLFFSWHIERMSLLLEDWEVLEMARAWPKLKQLQYYFQLHSPPPIDCIVHLARLCPDLRKLVLPRVMGAGQSPLEAFPIMSHGLRYIDLGRPACPQRVAQIADRLFPNLDTTYSGKAQL
ncbi:uncharacterized protein LAESUDRAFT_711308 [Laetiporus sulphureus 93-53]|uniref:F-box domain-containing protein n=1 Tax=Laetiporus sulphureus 93-53 TaxID=1314785 RepID=A0A165GVS5_9APHY|nr:uncharacterized protein LAESUDRAFT_711308 [Laetiporus sulphureus 93-53]KZT10889.1 hypothetical protein LAESUDRAFT_711308 [Laetiporus sulphureus 93-53]